LQIEKAINNGITTTGPQPKEERLLQWAYTLIRTSSFGCIIDTCARMRARREAREWA
jgi:hypothetical protein